MVEYQIPDNNYPDNYQKICQHYTSDIELTKENGDITVADAQIIYGDTIEELIESAGYSYTKDEIDAMIASLGGDGLVVNHTNWADDVLSADNTRYIIADSLNFNSVTDVPVGDNCEITFLTTGSFGNNVNLQINNTYIDAPLRQIFNGTKVTGFFHNSQIPVEWFGAKGDGKTDDIEAINTTIKYAGKSEVLLSAPIYVIGSSIQIVENNANFDSYDELSVEAFKNIEGGKRFLCKGSIYSTKNFTGYKVGNVTVPAMVHLAAANATVRIEGAIVVHADLTNCIGFLHEGYHDNKVYINRVMKGRDYIGYWNYLDGTNDYSNQAKLHLGTCDGVVYIYALGGDFECEQICGFNNGFLISDKYATAYTAVQQSSFKFASISANYGIRVTCGNSDGLIKSNTRGWFNSNRVIYNGISGDGESRRFIPTTTDCTFIKVDTIPHNTFCQNRFICNSVEPVWYKLIDLSSARGDYFEFLGNYGDCHVINYENGVPNASAFGGSAPTDCYNGLPPYTSTNKFINIRNAKDVLINTMTEFYAMPYDTIFVENSQNVVFTNCQSAKYLKDLYYQYDRNYRRFDKVIFTSSNESDDTSVDVTVFEVDKRELDQIKYVGSVNDIDTTVDGLYVITTPAYSSKFKLYPLYELESGVSTQLGYCYDYVGMITSHNELVAALNNVINAYTKSETDALLANKADKNGNANESFNLNTLTFQNQGAVTTMYNYRSGDNDLLQFYDRTGGSLTYVFDGTSHNIATTSDIPTKTSDLTNDSNFLVDANYVHTDNNYTTAEKNKLAGLSNYDDSTLSNKVDTLEDDIEDKADKSNTVSDVSYDFNSRKISKTINGSTSDVVTLHSVATTGNYNQLSNKPTIPTVDNSITGSNQTNPVTGGAIYTALQGKTGYVWYGSYDDMVDDSPSNGTIGFDSDNENFYIYDESNSEWKSIDQNGYAKYVKTTQAAYDALTTKESDTLYLIPEV